MTDEQKLVTPRVGGTYKKSKTKIERLGGTAPPAPDDISNTATAEPAAPATDDPED